MTTTLPIPWPIPDPTSLFSQAAGIYETKFDGIDARSANSVAATNCRIYAMTGYDLYLMQGALAQELMPNTANLWLPYHANIWQVPQLQPTAAAGSAIFAASASAPAPVTVPSGTVLSFAAGWLYLTTAAGTVAPGGTTSIPIVSALAGSAYNLPGGTALQLVSPIAGITPSGATLDAGGAANGTDLESTDNWRARIIAKIGQPGNGGSFQDYITWATGAGAPYVNVVPQAVGAGSVGIYIAAAGPAAATTALVNAVQAAIGVYGADGGVRPVTARALVMAATLVPVNITLHLNPNTALTQAAALSALQLFFAQSIANLFSAGGQQAQNQGGTTLYMSRLDNAISSADGEYSHERYVPTGDLVFLPSQMFVLGTVTFE